MTVRKMIELVHTGRKQFSDPDFMAMDMGNYYQSRQHIEKALTEYLIFAKYNPRQQKMILDKILIFSDEVESIPIIENHLLKSTGEAPENIHYFLSAL